MSDAESGNVGPLEGARTWLWPAFVTGAGTVGLCLWPLAADEHFRLLHHRWSWAPSIAVVSAIVLLGGQLWTTRALRTLARAHRERDREIARRVLAEDQLHLAMSAGETGLTEHLAVISRRLNQGPSERITLYRVDTDLLQLVRTARFCTNVTLKLGGREQLPIGEGVLDKAIRDERGEWRASLRFSDSKGQVDANVTGGFISVSVAEALRMPSREYFAKALTDASTGMFGAVIVFESSQVGGIDIPTARAETLTVQEPMMRAMAALASVTARHAGAHRATESSDAR